MMDGNTSELQKYRLRQRERESKKKKKSAAPPCFFFKRGELKRKANTKRGKSEDGLKDRLAPVARWGPAVLSGETGNAAR